MGEGAGIVVLEELEHARRRGARIYGEIVGYGATGDAYHITQPAPEGEGAQRVDAARPADAGLAPADVQYINAHGTSTPLNDLERDRARSRRSSASTRTSCNVSSTKSMTGHMLGAAGGVEFVVCTLAVARRHHPADDQLAHARSGVRPRTTCRTCAVKRDVDVALSNSFGFGGHNVHARRAPRSRD